MLFLSKEDWKKLSLKKKIWFIIGDIVLVYVVVSLPLAMLYTILMIADATSNIEIGGWALMIEFIIFTCWYIGFRRK